MNRLRHRSRQTLVWSSVFFVAMAAGIGVFLDKCPKFRDPAYGHKEASIRFLVAESPDRPVILALGSSRTLHGFHAGLVEESIGPDGPIVFNFGTIAAGPLTHLTTYQRLRAAGIRPDFLFVEVLPPLLNQVEGANVEETFLHGRQLGGEELARLLPCHRKPVKLLEQWALGRLAPYLFHRGALREAITGEGPRSLDSLFGPGILDRNGWLRVFPNGLSEEERVRITEMARLQYWQAFHPFRRAEGPIRALEELLDCCRRDGVPVALFMMPEGTAYRNWCQRDMVTGYEMYVAEVCHRKQVPLVDARTWVDDDGFWDSHHLLPAGAVQFSRRLVREVLQDRTLPALPRGGQLRKPGRGPSGLGDIKQLSPVPSVRG